MIPAYRWLPGLLLAALVLGACRPVTRPPDGTAALDPAHAEVLKQFVDVFDDTDATELDAILAPEFVSHNADLPYLTSKSAIADIVDAAHGVVPDFHQTLLDVFGDGEWYVLRTQYGGTWRRDPMVYGGMHFVRVVDNQIVEAWMVSDELAVDRVLAGIPNPEQRQWFSWGDNSPVTGNPGEPEANKALVMEWWEGDEAIRADLTGEQYKFHSTQFPKQHTYAERAAAIEELQNAFPDLEMTVMEPVLAEGDKVGFRFTAAGTNEGSFLGLAPSNEALSWPGIAIYRVADDKVVEEWILWSLDNLYYAIQR